MNPNENRDETLFKQALLQPSPAERAAYLDEACRGEPALRARLELLLEGHFKAQGFLDTLPQRGARTRLLRPASELTEKPGDRIGRYKLLQQIGEGGCGVVYMAEQEDPVRRRVALKIIKLGMDTRQVITRFEAERQALALMDHPNIAKVLDAGATEIGRPYFVMELIRGIKITDYCDEKNLSTRERLALFSQVCHAIQHAHQKGIIHRDIKPSNVLVTVNDGAAVPKVIDFGIAKAINDQRLTDKTLFTAFQQFVGTPAYMSPEQAEITSVDIDTRSDIYSLGVLLYELLTGKTPFDSEELLQAGLEAMRRTLREKEPERPSTRVSTLAGEELTTTAKCRGLDAPKLVNLLRGDLDWIVMKALEKDRARRYETANGLATDIQRHLSNEPVAACPPSNLYRLEKMVRRNKGAFLAVSLILALLIAGIGVSSWEAVRARRAEREALQSRRQAQADKKRAQTEAARNQEVVKFFEDMLFGVGPEVAKGRDASIIKEVLDKTAERVSKELTNQPEVEADICAAAGKLYEELGEYKASEVMLRRLVKLDRDLHPEGHRELAKAMDDLAMTLLQEGQFPQAEELSQQAVTMGKKLLGTTNTEVAAWVSDLAQILRHEGKYPEAESLYRQALDTNRKLFGHDHREVAVNLHNLALVLGSQHKFPEAESSLLEGIEIARKLSGDDNVLVAAFLMNLTQILLRQGKLEDAERSGKDALALQKKLLGVKHPTVALTLVNLAAVFQREGKLDQAEALAREALAIRREALAPDHLLLAVSLDQLGVLLEKRGNLPDAESALREALAIANKAPPNDAITPTNIVADLNKVLAAEGKSIEGKEPTAAPQTTKQIK